MADNVAFTPGTGATGATDDIGGVHYPRVKLALGADGAAADAVDGAGAVATGVQRVTLASDDPAVTSVQIMDDWDRTDACKVVGTTVIKDVTLSLDTSAYASGDVAADSQQVAGALRLNDGTGILQSVTVLDEDDQVWGGTLVLLDANVSLGTENAAPSITDANARSIIGLVALSSADFVDLGGCKVAHRSGLGIALKAVSGTPDIYVGLILTSGTPTFTASGVRLRLGILQD